MNLASPTFGRAAATIALASGVGISCPSSADAQIVYSGPVNINVPSTTAGVYINVVTGVFSAIPVAAPGWDINPWSASTLRIFVNNGASPSDGVVTN